MTTSMPSSAAYMIAAAGFFVAAGVNTTGPILPWGLNMIGVSMIGASAGAVWFEFKLLKRNLDKATAELDTAVKMKEHLELMESQVLKPVMEKTGSGASTH